MIAAAMAGRLDFTQANAKHEDDLESVTSFASGPAFARPTIKYAWSGVPQVDHDAYHHMLEQYKAAKEKQSTDELKIKQLAAQLARTEEAAKRALARSDQGAKGSTVQQLLNAQQQVQQLQTENIQLSSKLAKEKKRANDFRLAAEENRRRLEAALKEQRLLVRKLGETERSLGGSTAARKAARQAAVEQEYWSEEAGRRFAAQQEELLLLREQTKHLQQQVATAVPAETATKYEANIKELQQLVRFYEQRLMSSAAAAADTNLMTVECAVPSQEVSVGSGGWPLETLVECGVCYLWERSTGRVFIDVPDGQWPRPVGLKSSATSSIQLGCKGRLDSILNGLSEALGYRRSPSPAGHRPNTSSSSGRLADALQQLSTQGGCATNTCSSVQAGLVDTRDLPALLALLLPAAASKEIIELLLWLDVPQQSQGISNQAITLGSLDAAAKELLSAREAVRQGRDSVMNEALTRVRRLLRQEAQTVTAAFQETDRQQAGLSSLQIVQLLKQQQLLPDLSPTEARYLHILLHEWDLTGSMRHTLADVCAALQLLPVKRTPLGTLPAVTPSDRPDSRLSTASTSNAANSVLTAQPSLSDKSATSSKHYKSNEDSSSRRKHPGVAAASGADRSVNAQTLREAYLVERVSTLESELAQVKSGKSTGSNQQVDGLRAEVARYQARLTELENDFLSLEIVTNTDAGDYDAEMRKAWFTAAAFKKRYIEHKAELDSIKATAEDMQASLHDTHRALHAETARRMALEEAAAVARMEAARAKELAAAVSAERTERIKLEKDYLELQSKAFAAPGGALAEVRTLREELLAARRERAVGEAREAELRRELAAIKRQFEGVCPEEHKRLVRELAETQRKCVSNELDLRAALDKLEVFRRTEAALQTSRRAAASGDRADASISGEGDSVSDEGKTESELLAEVSHLRHAVARDAEELNKLRKLLDTEAAISMEAKAALEEAQAALQAAKAEAAQQLAKLRKELDTKEETIRKLEGRLRGAYSGLSKAAMRASAVAVSKCNAGDVRVSRVGHGGSLPLGASLEEMVQELRPKENAIELIVSEAMLMESEVPANVSTFVAWDFFIHDTQATPVAAGHNPAYKTTVQYIVEVDDFLFDYLSQHKLAFELFEAKGWDATPAGIGYLSLSLLLQDLETGAGVGEHRVWHHVDIFGNRGQKIGRLRVGVGVIKPTDKFLQQYKTQHDQTTLQDVIESAAPQPIRPLQAPHGLVEPEVTQGVANCWDETSNAVQQAAEQADAEPSKASHLLITIHRCQGLVLQSAHNGHDKMPGIAAAVQRPYIHYTPPGRTVGHDSGVREGDAPIYNDAACWAYVRSKRFEQALHEQSLQVAVFDDGVQDPSTALIGVADIPMASLADSVPVEGVFDVVHPATSQSAGRIQVTMSWQPALAGTRVPALQLATSSPPTLTTVDSVQTATAGCVQQWQLPVWPMQPVPSQESIPVLTSAHNNEAQHLPTISATAAAAVTKVLSNRQQQLYTSDKFTALRVPQTSNPAAAFEAIQDQPCDRQQIVCTTQGCSQLTAASHRYFDNHKQLVKGTATSVVNILKGLSSAARLEHPAAQAPVGDPATQAVVKEQAQCSGTMPVMRVVSPNVSTWDALDTTVYFKIGGLQLTQDALQDPALQHLLLAHMFCEDYTSAAQQCTATIPVGPGVLMFNYAVAYSIADPVTKIPTPAGVALARALATAEGRQTSQMVLPLLLASSHQATVRDFSKVDCVATCEVNLSNIWEGLGGDMVDQAFELTPSADRMQTYSTGCMGSVQVTLYAAAAFKALRRWGWQRYKADGADTG